MIIVRVDGPMNECPAACSQVKAVFQAAGKVVRHYVNHEPEAPVPACNVLLIERHTKGAP